jgi:flagellar biogenesis protein FliO
MGIMAVSTGISLVIIITIVLVIAWVIHEHL